MKKQDFFENQYQRNPTMKDVAKTAGVSVSSVSHVLNGTRFVSNDIIKKVEAAIDKLNYRPNSVARNLRSGKSGIIGFVVANLENSFYVRIAKGIERVVNSYGYNLLLIDSSENKQKEKSNIQSLYLRGIDGLLVVPTDPDCSYISSIIRDNNYPIVFLDRYPHNYEGDVVLLDNKQAGYEATKHLLEKGLNKIGFIAIQFRENIDIDGIDEIITERLVGYKNALKDYGIIYDEKYIKTSISPPAATEKLQFSKAYQLTNELFSLPVDAIIAANNHTSIGVFTWLKANNIFNTNKVRFVAFDDDFWHHMTTPAITTVTQPAEEIGRIGAMRLLERLSQNEFLKPTCYRLKAKILKRETTI